MIFAAIAGAKQDGVQFIPAAVAAGAVAILALPGTEVPPGVALIETPRPRQHAGQARRASGRAAAACDRRHHRHQRQDQQRRFPASDLDPLAGSSPPPRSARWASSPMVRPPNRASPRPIRSRWRMSWPRLQAGGIDHVAIEASSHGLDQARLDGVQLAAARLHQPDPRSSRLSRHMRPTAPPSCVCSRRCCPRRARGDRTPLRPG